MTKDVLIRISGLQSIEGDPDVVEVITAGDYYLRNGKHYVVYDEAVEGFEGSIRNTLKLTPDMLDVRKTGVIRSHMVFALNRKEQTHYQTPMGEMFIETATNAISFDEQEDSLQMKVDYSLDINYEHVSDCSITLDICSREKAQLHLRESRRP